MRPNQVLALVLVIFGTIITSLRIYTRCATRRAFPDVSDWGVILACVATWIMFATYGAYYAASMAVYPDVPISRTEEELRAARRVMAQWNNVNGLSFCLATFLTKFSMLLFYYKLSPQQWFRRTVWVSMAILVAYTVVTGITFPLMSISDDKNVQKAFQVVLAPGTRTYNWCNASMDLIMLCLPVAIIVPLHLSMRRKLSLAVVFVFGFIITGIAIYRALVPFITVKERFILGPIAYWEYGWRFIIIEGNVSVMCASLPLLAQFFSTLLPQYKGSFSRRWRLYRKAKRIDGEEVGISTTNAASESQDNTVVRMNKKRRAEKEAIVRQEKDQMQESESYEMSKPPSTATTAYSADNGRVPDGVYPMDEEGGLLPSPPARTHWAN